MTRPPPPCRAGRARSFRGVGCEHDWRQLDCRSRLFLFQDKVVLTIPSPLRPLHTFPSARDASKVRASGRRVGCGRHDRLHGARFARYDVVRRRS